MVAVMVGLVEVTAGVVEEEVEAGVVVVVVVVLTIKRELIVEGARFRITHYPYGKRLCFLLAVISAFNHVASVRSN